MNVGEKMIRNFKETARMRYWVMDESMRRLEDGACSGQYKEYLGIVKRPGRK